MPKYYRFHQADRFYMFLPICKIQFQVRTYKAPISCFGVLLEVPSLRYDKLSSKLLPLELLVRRMKVFIFDLFCPRTCQFRQTSKWRRLTSTINLGHLKKSVSKISRRGKLKIVNMRFYVTKVFRRRGDVRWRSIAALMWNVALNV